MWWIFNPRNIRPSPSLRRQQVGPHLPPPRSSRHSLQICFCPKIGCPKCWCRIISSPSKWGVSWIQGTPKSSILTRFSITNHPFWWSPMYGHRKISIWRPPHPGQSHPRTVASAALTDTHPSPLLLGERSSKEAAAPAQVAPLANLPWKLLKWLCS